jgi:hypothetical protein
VLRHVAITAVVAAGLAAVPAATSASPDSDYEALHADWQPDGRITHCRWSASELGNARSIATITPTDSYTTFPAALDAEISSQHAGSCAAGTGANAPRPSSRITLTVSPASVRSGKRTQLRFRATARGVLGNRVPVAGATIGFAGATTKTDAQGLASLTHTVTGTGRRIAVARHAGLQLGRATVRLR